MPDKFRNLNSRVAGVFVASNYSIWQMQISGGPYPAASPQTFTVVSGAVTLRDGRTPNLFTNSATVEVGSGANAEPVTITATTNMPGFGLPLNSSTLSGNTSNAHGQGDIICSNSGGLFEACSDAIALFPSGGVTVVVDPDCSATSAQIATARQLFPTLTIESAGTSQIQSASVTLTSAQLLALQTTAVTVIPAPGTDAWIIPIGIGLQYKAGATAYTIANADNAFQLEYVGKTTNIVKTNATGVVDQTVSETIAVAPAVAGTVIAQTNVAGLGVEVKLVGTTPALTLGNGTVKLTVNYYVAILN